MKKLLLLDGNSMLFRAYYATMYRHSMQTSNGIPTNAVYGFIMMLQKALDTIQPDALLVAWDADSQTFRKQEYEPYKGTRKPLDDELKVCRSFLPKMPNSNVVLTYNWYDNLSKFRNEVIYIKYFKLYDKALEENEFFKNISYSPLYSIPGIFKYIKKDSDLYLKDWSGNNNDFNCVEPTNLKSDVIISNLSLKE